MAERSVFTDKEKATEATEYPVVPAVAGPTPARPWKLVELPSPGGLLLLPWTPVDSTVPVQPIVISPEAQARSTPVQLPAVPPEQAAESGGTAILFVIAYRLKGPAPEPPLPVAPPGYRLERDPNYRPEPKAGYRLDSGTDVKR
jgi:hypothetical protein